jgi:hypothetical protein
MNLPHPKSVPPQPHKVEPFHLYAVVDGLPIPVVQAAEIAQLFPNRRDKDQLAELANSILENGQDGEVLLLRGSEHLICIDGHDVLRAIAVLQSRGHAIKIAYRLFGVEGTPQEILRKCLTFVIRQKLSQQTCKLDDLRKDNAIIQYFLVCYSQGHSPSDRSVADEVCCSHTWVRDVRERAVDAGKLPRVDHYVTKDNRRYEIRTPLEKVETIPLEQGVPTILTESQEEDERQEKKEREAELERAVAAAPEGKAAAEPTAQVNPEVKALPPPAKAVPEPVDRPGDPLAEDASRFAQEMSVVIDWDQSRERPLGKDVCKRLWAADLLDVDTESKRVFMLADKSEIEHILVDMLAPLVRELGLPDPDRSVIAAIHSLLHPTVKKSPRRK